MCQEIMERLARITPEEEQILRGETELDRNLYMDGSRDVITGDKLLQPGQLIAIRPHTRFIAFPEHTHDYVEMVYMCRGSTTHRVNGRTLELRAGDLLLLGQNARQAIEPAGAGDVAVNFIVRPSFFSGTLPFWGQEETPLRQFILSCLSGEREAGWLFFHVGDILPIQNLLENLLSTLLTKTPNKRGILQLTMGLLFAHLLNHTEALQPDSWEQTVVLSALRYIEEHYRDGTLGELAEREHFEISALSRLIRARTGKTYTQLVQDKRLSQAAWLLKNTDKRVEEIARLTGYENKSYFHRIFAAAYGCSPKHYRDAAL